MTKHQPSDFGPAELRHHHETRDELVDIRGTKRIRVITQRPCDRYLQRNQITRRLWDASERLVTDWTAMGLEPKVCMQWSDFIDCGIMPTSLHDRRADGAKQFWAAMDAAGRAAHGVLWHVVCMGESAGSYATRQGEPKRAGLSMLRLALGPVADHYRIP